MKLAEEVTEAAVGAVLPPILLEDVVAETHRAQGYRAEARVSAELVQYPSEHHLAVEDRLDGQGSAVGRDRRSEAEDVGGGDLVGSGVHDDDGAVEVYLDLVDRGARLDAAVDLSGHDRFFHASAGRECPPSNSLAVYSLIRMYKATKKLL